MTNIIIYGGASGLALLAGAWAGIYFKFKDRIIARFMAFGAGVLICALTFGLMEQAFNHGGFDAVFLGFLLGGLMFIAGDYVIHILGGTRHRKIQHFDNNASINGKAITMGALLDGIPESTALGIALFAGGGTGILMLFAIILSNFPEGISSISGLKKAGFSTAKIISIWLIVAIILATISVLSYVFLHDLNLNAIGAIESFAAGAILAMLANSMMPEAFEEGGPSIGMLTIFGFLTAFILAKI